MKSQTSTTIYWTLLNQDGWHMYLAATTKGLCYVGSQHKPFEELTAWVQNRFPNCHFIRDDEKLEPYVKELTEYLNGQRGCFSIPFDLQGTPFQLAVWEALCQVPYGQIQTYSQIADSINKPSAVRAVGAAIGANPLLITVPCHRVIGKNGSLTGYRGGLEMKTQLLQLEREGSQDERG
ncbi:methylated-DNA--[protein]-cysteine S-methyltransferase [Paenibacillus agilis]|uniref:methylated-DNA--[protein]-cysteine S-methyltransferase n=1 Tax=Paenibacillus agilis TaxID=3020863 RepID=A0A559IQ67_9BACL|nr:methylated-DNA--[protein]-cysteine S-methyltransferase [Paenibacillus agilis]TVX89740.1 methylated-DNA--[protein]-cysteine S-methyltransferase [Paenibacillus agilis]